MRNIAISVIVGSQILGLLRMLDKEDLNKGSTIRYATHIRGKINRVDKDPTWAKIVVDSLTELTKGNSKNIALPVVIETLSFNFEKELSSFYGYEYFTLMNRFVHKQSYGNVSDYAKDSYEVADILTKIVRKMYFEGGR